MNCLNLGCGKRYHPTWTNVNFVSTDENVIAHNLNQGIPFPDRSFDVVYHSHLLEHFPKHQAEPFLKECHRVLSPQGIIRIAVPDLEGIARSYIDTLERALADDREAAINYNWLLIELFDQTVRNSSGGDMAAYLFQENIANEDFIVKRLGSEAKDLIKLGRQRPHQSISTDSPIKHLLKQVYRFLRYPNYRRENVIKLLLGEEYNALQIGRFRQSGEVHQWMYDRYSLTQLLKKCGFEQIRQRSADDSYISDWASFHLDTEPDGSVYKPDSLYLEAIKPSL